MKKVTVVGAGFSGLASAYYLARAGFSVVVVEASARAGGLIKTLSTEDGLIETAANAFLNSPLVEDMFATIGVPMIGTLPQARRRYIFRQGRARRWPIGVLSSLRVAWFFARFLISRAGFASRDWVAPHDHESVQAWSERVMGHEAAQYLVASALQGIYAGDPSRMSARLIVGRFFSQPSGQRRGSPAIRGSVSAPNGMSQIIDALVSHLRRNGVEFKFAHSFDLMDRDEGPVILATSPFAAADILATQKISEGMDIDPRIALLRAIEVNGVTTTTAFFTQSNLEGFGVLFAPIERRRVLGVLKNNYIFANRANKMFSETWIQGGALAPAPTAEVARATILEERRSVFRLNDAPASMTSTRWEHAIPHYTIELEEMIPTLEELKNNILLMGNYLGDLGLAKILERASRLPEQLV